MMEARDPYQDLILDHHRAPHNCGPLPYATHRAEGDNPLCGDNIVVSLVIVDDVISTGSTLQGMHLILDKAGAEIVADAAILTEGDRARWRHTISLGHLPVWLDNSAKS